MPQAPGSSATLADLLAIPEEDRFHELLSGTLVRKATPSGEHGGAQAGVVAAIGPVYQRRPGGDGPGGWWIATEVECLLLEGTVVRPDVVGWRRQRSPERPRGTPVKLRPDWVCEIVSPSNANVDTVKKLRLYHEAAVPHYWVVDPRDATLTVMRWSDDGYVTRIRAERGEVVRPPPIDEIEVEVGVLLGDDPA